MGVYLKNTDTNSPLHVIEVENDNWDLDSQLESLESWFCKNPNHNFYDGEWIADVGFEPRSNVSVAGYTVSIELMKHLAKNKITLWLSDYRGV